MKTTTPSRPRSYTEQELAKVGIRLVDAERAHLYCEACGLGFSPDFITGGKLPRGYWRCPNGCNAPKSAK